MLRAASPDIERRVEQLLARMTIEEKLGQMSQSTSIKTPLSEEIKAEIRSGRWGSFLNAGSLADRIEAQRIAVQESRLGIPLLFGRDVIHGYRTVFPIPLGQSASWDTALIEQAARVAGQEAFSDGIAWTFAPMLDISRDPRWGRIAEGLGEDPYLASVLGAAMVRGFQTKALDSPGAIAACAKHYVGYGAAEAGRDYNSAWIPEIQLREVYLKPFRAAVEAGVATVMTGFQALNGVPATGNVYILREILRREFGFRGMVVSDYTAVPEMIEHGFARDDSDAAAKAVRAGVEMEMVSTTYFDRLKRLIETGQVQTRDIDDAVRNILRLKFELGLFDHPLTSDARQRINQDPNAARETAKRLAQESIVLLKNDTGNGVETLPLTREVKKIAVIGPLADSPVDQMGSWAMDGRAEDVQTPLAALRARLGNRIVYAAGLKNSRDMDRSGFAEALKAARDSDVVLMFLGEEQILSGEAHSRAFLDLPGAQNELVNEIAGVGKPVVGIIMAGRPLTFHDAAGKMSAILYAWHPGTMGGPAIADILFGDAVPSGKTTITFPRTVGQVPIYYAHLNTGRPATANDLGIPLGNPVNPAGYRSKYVDVDFTPEYPFGFGLSYTRFEYSELRLSHRTLRRGEQMTVSAQITNKGRRDGDEVVQLYIHRKAASVAQPVRELKGFTRVRLRAGETRRVSLNLSYDDLAFYRQTANGDSVELTNEPGTIQIWISPDSVRGVEGEFALE